MLYKLTNAAMPTTTVITPVTTGTTIKTMLQVKLGTSVNNVGRVVEWGISFDGSAAAAGIRVELCTTGAIKATVTEFLATGIQNLSDPYAAAVTDDNPFAFGAAGDESGYTATAEGSITSVRVFDSQIIQPTSQYVKQYPLGREPAFNNTEYLRIRVLAAAAVNAYCYVIVEV